MGRRQPAGQGNRLGGLVAALCQKGGHIRALAASSSPRIEAALKRLPVRVNETDARKIGWYYSLETLSDGVEFHYFPVLAFGHGVLSVYTGVLYDNK